MSVKRINGYRIFLNEKLGKGSYGTVYRGESNDRKLLCAVKILDKSSINQDPYLKAALVSEIKIMKAVRDDNIVFLYDVMESSNNYYIIQELCDGDLENYLKSKSDHVLDEKEAVKILTEICSGFISLVKEGIVHRDLKPANIFLSKDHCKIGDFGFAKKNQSGLKNQTAVGTPLYMSIELLKGEPYTSKCDIWAMGFILYEMLHGTTPWTARSEYELIQNIEKKPLKLSQKLTPQMSDFLKKCLQVTQQKRISWDEVFKHPIFGSYFSKQIEQNGYLENVFKKIMADIRFQTNSKNLNLKNLWERFGYSPEKQLNQKEFKEFVSCVVPKMAPVEEEYFFKKMDANKDGSVSLKELEIQFQKHGIPLTSKFQENIPYLKKYVSIEEDPDDLTLNDNIKGAGEDLEKKIREAFRKFDYTLTKKKLTLWKVYTAYDGNKSGQLEINEFAKILKRLDPQFSEEEIQMIFDLVDVDNSKTIEFDELKSYFCKINGIPESLHNQECLQKK